MKPTRTLEEHLAHLWETEASRDHLLKDGHRLLNAAEVAYLFGFHEHRSSYRLPIARSRHGTLAKDVKRYLERVRSSGATARETAQGSRTRARESTPWWGGDAA